MVKRKLHPTPEIGEKFGNWVVVDTTYKQRYPKATNRAALSHKGVTVECRHGIQALRSLSELHKKSIGGCQQCGVESRFKGCGDLSMSYLNSVQIGAKKRGLEYSVTPEYLWKLFEKQDR